MWTVSSVSKDQDQSTITGRSLKIVMSEAMEAGILAQRLKRFKAIEGQRFGVLYAITTWVVQAYCSSLKAEN